MAKAQVSRQTTIYLSRTDVQFSFHERPEAFVG